MARFIHSPFIPFNTVVYICLGVQTNQENPCVFVDVHFEHRLITFFLYLCIQVAAKWKYLYHRWWLHHLESSIVCVFIPFCSLFLYYLANCVPDVFSHVHNANGCIMGWPSSVHQHARSPPNVCMPINCNKWQHVPIDFSPFKHFTLHCCTFMVPPSSFLQNVMFSMWNIESIVQIYIFFLLLFFSVGCDHFNLSSLVSVLYTHTHTHWWYANFGGLRACHLHQKMCRHTHAHTQNNPSLLSIGIIQMFVCLSVCLYVHSTILSHTGRSTWNILLPFIICCACCSCCIYSLVMERANDIKMSICVCEIQCDKAQSLSMLKSES